MKKAVLPVVLIAFALAVSGCGSASYAAETQQTGALLSETVQEAPTQENTQDTEQASSLQLLDASEMFTDRDMEIGYDDDSSIRISLNGESASCSSQAVQISGGTVTITQDGTYILSGSLNDGTVVVDAPDTAKLQLVLDGVDISSSGSAAIYIVEADKVFITTAADSENSLENGGEYIAVDDNNIDAVIFSKTDLTLNGSGTLTIHAGAGHGIVSKDDLVLTSGSYEIEAASHGISGKDSVRIANGTFSIVSGKDGIHSENSDNAELGFIYISGGSFNIDAQGDGLSAASAMQIDGGDFDISTGEGSASVTMKTDSMGLAFRENSQSLESETEESISQKGLKCDGSISVSGGNFTTDTSDDSIHGGGDILISNGTFVLKSGDDAIHSDAAVKISNGDISISYCYEGIEGLSLTIDDGSYNIQSEDDGLNAAGGVDSSGFGGSRPGQEQFSSDSQSFITINGGKFAIVSKGDCIDSNGDLTINGGTLDLTCSGSGNTALDCDGQYSNNGGQVNTNDGSENNLGQTGGGMGGHGGGRAPGDMAASENVGRPEGLQSQDGMETPQEMEPPEVGGQGMRPGGDDNTHVDG